MISVYCEMQNILGNFLEGLTMLVKFTSYTESCVH